MIAALYSCAAVRFYVVQMDFPQDRRTLDMPITALALMFAAAAVIRMRPDPVMGLVYATAFGALGLVTDAPLAPVARAGEVVTVPAGSGATEAVGVQPQVPDEGTARAGANLSAAHRGSTTQAQPVDQQAVLRAIDKADQPPA